MEKPWIDVTKAPLDPRKYAEAGIDGSAVMPELGLFILVRRSAGNYGPSSMRGYGAAQVAVITGNAEVQVGNARLTKTFTVSGALSICESTPGHISCETDGSSSIYDTPEPGPKKPY